jgi:hypothetical protein
MTQASDCKCARHNAGHRCQLYWLEGSQNGGQESAEASRNQTLHPPRTTSLLGKKFRPSLQVDRLRLTKAHCFTDADFSPE